MPNVFARSSVVAATLALAMPGAARAQSAADRATARQLGQDGQAALDAKDYVTAEDRFRRADALFHAPTLLLGWARAEAALGKLVNASEAYNRIVREGVAPGASEAFLKAVEAAKAEAGAVEARIASVTVVVSGPDNPRVTLDDQPLPTAALGVKRPVDPGAHVVKASADGWDPAETKFTVTDAATTSAMLTLKRSVVAGAATIANAPTSSVASAPVTGPSAPAEPAPEPDHGPPSSHAGGLATVGWVGVVAGGVGLATGAIAGILAIGKHSTLANECSNPSNCNAQSDISSYHTLGTLSTVGFIAGGVLAGAGLVLVFTSPSSPPSSGAATVRPYVGLGSIGAVGAF
jgi:hypothetical protein